MSNLGYYQKMTELAKKAGGPINLLFITLGGGYFMGKCIEKAIKKGNKIIKTKKLNKFVENDAFYEVLSSRTDEKGFQLNKGDTYKIVSRIDDVIIIEKIGDKNNPYCVSLDFLRSVSSID